METSGSRQLFQYFLMFLLLRLVAGNQFMVMEELIGDFQSEHPDIKTIYMETIPSGQILKQQLLAQGQINSHDTAHKIDGVAIPAK